MTYVIWNPVKSNTIEIEAELEAIQKLEEVRAEYLATWEDKFSVLEEHQVGDLVEWRPTTLEKETATYVLYNPLNGLHEKYQSKTEMVYAIQKIKEKIVSGVGLDRLVTREDLAKNEANLPTNFEGPLPVTEIK